MGLSRRSRNLLRKSEPISAAYLDKLVSEFGVEYTGEKVDDRNDVKFTRYQLLVYDCIKKNPGIWKRELERRLGISSVEAVNKLVRFGVVKYVFEDGKKKFYVVGGVDDIERR